MMEYIKRDRAFLDAIKAERWRESKWIFKTFTFTYGETIHKDFDPYLLDEDGSKRWVMQINGSPVELRSEEGEVLSTDQPAYKLNGKLVITKNDISFLREDSVETRYGKIYLNMLLLYAVLGNRFPYMNGPIDVGKVEENIYGRGMLLAVSDPNHPDAITVDEYVTFATYASSLEGFSKMAVPTSTRKSLQTDPRIPQVIKDFVEKNKDRMSDPVVIAELDKIIVEMDIEWLKDDPSIRFYINRNKNFGIARKAMYSAIGGKAGMTDGQEMTFIGKPLSEGIDIDNLVVMNDESRAGSYDRGIQTATGGTIVKGIGSITQTIKIVDGDCGSDIGIVREVREDNKKRFLGLYYLDKNFKPVNINDGNIDSLIGKRLEMRTTAYCKSENYCSICMGDNNSRVKTGASSEAMSFGDRWMYLFMKSMHGRILASRSFDHSKWLH